MGSFHIHECNTPLADVRPQDWATRYDGETGWDILERVRTWCARWWAEAIAGATIEDGHEWADALRILQTVRGRWGRSLRSLRVTNGASFFR